MYQEENIFKVSNGTKFMKYFGYASLHLYSIFTTLFCVCGVHSQHSFVLWHITFCLLILPFPQNYKKNWPCIFWNGCHYHALPFILEQQWVHQNGLNYFSTLQVKCYTDKMSPWGHSEWSADKKKILCFHKSRLYRVCFTVCIWFNVLFFFNL